MKAVLQQAGFVQDRSIAENVWLVQEIISEIRKKDKPPNLVIKLDMVKAYDGAKWIFLMKVSRKIGSVRELSIWCID